MPKGVIKTAKDESRWSRAKELAENQYPDASGPKFWKIVMGIFKKMKGMKKLSKAVRRAPMPSAGEVTEGYNIGDEKEFPDGSTRKLGYSSGTGVRRWLGIGGDEEAADSIGGQTAMPEETEPQSVEEKKPEGIEKEEWQGFNKYLTVENPFLNCQSYDEIIIRWYAMAYEYDERLNINEKIYDENINKKIKKDIADLDNYLLAFMMYKISFMISKIMEWEPEFNYEKFIKDHEWNQFFEYLEKKKEPVEIDYSELYQE
jgi:hypothetical protein